MNLGGNRAVDLAGFAKSKGVRAWLSGGAAVLDGAGRILVANEALASWLGVSPAELQGQHLAPLLGGLHPEWEIGMAGFLARALPLDRLELSAFGASGKLRIEAIRRGDDLFLRLDTDPASVPELENLFPESCWGRVVGHQVFQRTLRSEAQLETLMSRWPGILFSQRPDLTFSFISPRIEELTGLPVAEWRAKPDCLWRVVHEADVATLQGRVRACAQAAAGPAPAGGPTGAGPDDGAAGGLVSTFRIRHVQTGRVSYLWEHRRALRGGSGALLGYEGMWLDITRQTIAEHRLLHMSWRENLGTLTAGMAHDFCNIMTGIVGLSEAFESSLEPGNSLREGLGLIRNTAYQAGQMAHRIRRLQQGSPGEKKFLDLNETLVSLGEVLPKVLPRHVKIHTALAPGQLPVFVDPVELQQVIVNLALNAVDAMPEGGQLTFRTSRHPELPALQPLVGSVPRLPAVCLSVQDTGSGIPPKFLNSIFDPFFTTKPLGKGSGLGLYNTRLFVEKHTGAVSVETALGKGTAFHLWFAEADFTETDAPAAVARPQRHTLLVVGNSGPALNQLVGLLRENGFYAVPASTEAEAAELLQAPHFQFTGALVLCGNAPPPVAQTLRKSGRGLRTILVPFGLNQDEVPAHSLAAADALVPLDLAPHDFLARLQAALNDGSPARDAAPASTRQGDSR